MEPTELLKKKKKKTQNVTWFHTRKIFCSEKRKKKKLFLPEKEKGYFSCSTHGEKKIIKKNQSINQSINKNT